MLGTLLTAQEYSPRSELGSSTSSVMFARTIGGSVGVSILSAIIAQNLDSSLTTIQNSFWWAYLTCTAFAICAFIISIFHSYAPLPDKAYHYNSYCFLINLLFYIIITVSMIS